MNAASALGSAAAGNGREAMREAVIGAALMFLLLGGFFLAGPEEHALMRAHPCWDQPCNW
jgi:hypothetical protein